MIDTVLQEREFNGRPIRVGMIGAGATGRAIALQLATPVPGMRLSAIANRSYRPRRTCVSRVRHHGLDACVQREGSRSCHHSRFFRVDG